MLVPLKKGTKSNEGRWEVWNEKGEGGDDDNEGERMKVDEN